MSKNLQICDDSNFFLSSNEFANDAPQEQLDPNLFQASVPPSKSSVVLQAFRPSATCHLLVVEAC